MRYRFGGLIFGGAYTWGGLIFGILRYTCQSGIVIKFDNHVTSQHGDHFKSREFSYSPFFVRGITRILKDLVKTKINPAVPFLIGLGSLV